MSNNLSQKAIKGLSWSYLSVIAHAGSQIFIGAIMARLLTPADFGIVAISNLVLRFGQYFSQLGMASAVIQKKELSAHDEATAHNLALLSGLLVALICFFGTPLLKGILDNAEVLPVIRVMSFTFVLSAFGIVSDALLRRNMRFRFLAIADVLSYLLAYGIGILLAYNGKGVWALVTAMLLQQFIRSLMNFIAVRHSIVPIIYAKSFKALLSYGGRSSFVGFLEFLYKSMDTFFIGRFLGAASLGLFNRVKIIVDLPLYYIGSNFGKVLFPLFSSLNSANNDGRLRKGFLDSLLLLTIMLMPMTVLVSASSELVIAVLLGEQWMSALVQARLIPFASLFGLLGSIFGILFDSRGLLTRKILIMGLLLVLLFSGFILLKPFNSLTVYTLLLVGGSFTLLCSNAFWLSRDLSIALTSYLKIAAAGIIVSTPVAVAAVLCTLVFTHSMLNPFVALPLVWIVSGAVGVFWFVKGPFRNEREIVYERVLKSVCTKLPAAVSEAIMCNFCKNENG